MVRAPCCEKTGLKKGPWAQEEDQILISYIKRNGHGNWRALPKQAGNCSKKLRIYSVCFNLYDPTFDLVCYYYNVPFLICKCFDYKTCLVKHLEI